MHNEMEQSEKNDIRRCAKQYKHGRPEIIESILKTIGDQM